MTLPGIGPVTLSGLEHPQMLFLGVVPAALLVLYVVVQVRNRRRVRRYVNSELMDSVASQGASPWRHVPVGAALVALLFLTVALAVPSQNVRIPRNRAVIMLVVDVSQSMRATDVTPSRLAAARESAKIFAAQLTPGVNLGLISFAGHANVLVSPTPEHGATISALDNLHPDNSTATGDAILAALQSIATVAAVLGGGDTAPPPARIVLLSDGKENEPENPDNPHGAYTAARAAKDQGVPVSTISFGTAGGVVSLDNRTVPVPVDADMMKQIAQLSGGQFYTASNIDELNRSYDAIEQQVGYQTVPGPASAGWLRLAVLVATLGALLALVINRRLPT
ncbi:VWA domain-containing protein [Mycolicibacterium komossense]|uniref:VWA domain-containing protein n=1 Tax=Mycolicibacterium komossense TaxID=1779 RepID=A0ABT3CM85_9MYCO|nr:VWA domain-containing protein [Mycolicibacterium komossense]MCV7230527.1 VWA domain-containing protein [Mycolicibacterium komossense]